MQKIQITQATTNNVPETRTMYIGVWEGENGSVNVGGLPQQDIKIAEHHLIISSRQNKGWKRIISFEVPYFKKADNDY